MTPAEPTVHDNRPAAGPHAPADPQVEDLAAEAAVLALLLDVHPAPLTREEVRRRLLATARPSFSARDQVDRAVTEVLAHGAAHDAGGWLIASHAAVYVARIDR